MHSGPRLFDPTNYSTVERMQNAAGDSVSEFFSSQQLELRAVIYFC